jgi:undecaprenyl-diphosphatase
MFWQLVHQLDQQVTLAINSWHSTFTDPIWQFFSDKIVWIPVYVAIIALLIWKLGWKKGLMVIAAAGLTFGFCDQFSNIIKHAVGRIRPLKDEFMLSQGLHILENGGGYSFFSAHAANAFGLACSTFFGMRGCMKSRPCWLKAYGIWMFFWAAMVSISRIFVGKHYLGDVLVGTLVGVLAGYFFGWLAARIAAKK